MSSVPALDIPWAWRPTGLDDIPFVAFDTETTGLHASDRLVELAAVRFRGGEVEAEWTSLVNPGVPIPETASAIHGLRDADVATAPPATAVLPAFLGFIEGAALVGHNSPFDVRVLALELLRAGLPLPDNPVLDTCALSRRLALDVPNHRLGTLAQAFGVRCGAGHRALADARVARELLRAYL
jgi:DNA polymerase III subunit epsilon